MICIQIMFSCPSSFLPTYTLWPRYWLELLQSFQDQLKDKTPHLLNLARKGFLILKLTIIISLSTKIYYQDWKDIVTYFKILIQSQPEYEPWWFTKWIELRIDVGIFTHQMICRRLFVRKASQRSFFTKTSEIGSL